MERYSFISSSLANNFSLHLTSTLILALLFLAQSCKSPTAPKGNSPPDTTSQNFTWQKYYFGVGGYTLLNDVTIISDSDIWAVGSIYLNDSTGKPEIAQHNAVHWDGKKWTVIKIPYDYQGQAFYGPIYSIWAFNANNIWFGIGNMIQWDGQAYNPINIPTSIWGPHRILKVFGTGSASFYIVGDGGSIAYYDGSTWQKIESGTNMSINDIWGAYDSQTGNSEILAVASYPDTSAQRKILQINGTSATTLSSSGINWDLHSVWFKPKSQYYVAGSGIYNKHLLNDNTWSNQYFNVTNYYINCIRGNDTNDVVAVGSFGEVIHYNGKRWKSFRDETGLADGEYLSVAIKGNEIVAVGYDGQRAVILVGKR